MRKFTISLSIIFLLLISAVIFGPGFVDWNKYKNEITNQVLAKTGRHLQIEGDLSLRVLPTPSFSARKVKFANASQSSQETMINLEELGVKVAVLPLLSGNLRVDEVILRKPIINLERFPDGTGNWELSVEEVQNQSKSTDSPSSSKTSENVTDQGSDFFQGVTLDRFQVIDGTVHFVDGSAGVEETFQGINVEVSARSLTGPISLGGDLLLRGQKTEIELDLGQFAEEGATAIKAGVRLPDSQAKLKFSGSLSKHVNSISYRGKFEGDGSDLGALFSELLSLELTTKSSSDFELAANLEGDLKKVSVTDLIFRVGAQKITGEINVDLQDHPIIALNLASPRVNLDDILARNSSEKTTTNSQGPASVVGGATENKTGATEPVVTNGAKTQTWPELSDTLTLNAQLSVKDIIYNRQIVRDFVFQSHLKNGLLEVKNLSARLPNGGHMSLAANYQNQTVNGQLATRTDDLRGLMTWLDLDVPAVPNDRLRRLDGKVRFSLQPAQLVLNPISVTLDVSHLDGAATIALRDRLGIGARLVIDRIDLDAYRGSAPLVEDKTEDVNQSVAEGNSVDNSTAEQSVQSSEKKPNSFLNATDANLDITVGELVYKKVPIKGVKLDGTLQQGVLQVRNASLDDVVGSSLAVSGTFSELEVDPVFDATVIASVADLPKLLVATGDGQKGSVPNLGRLELSGSLRGTSNNLDVDVLGSALGGSYQAQGKITPKDAILYNGLLSIDHPDASKLVRKITPGASTNPNWGRLTAKSIVKASPGRIELSELDGTIAKTKIQGNIIADMLGAKPKITANLATGQLKLSHLLPEAPKGGSSGGASGGGGFQSAGLNRRWSHQEIDILGLASVDADIALIADGIQQNKLRINNAQVKANLQDAVLSISQFSGSMYGGPVSVTGFVNGQGQLLLDLDVVAENIDTSSLFREMADFKRVTGPISLTGKIKSQGSSEAELVQRLNGAGSVQGVLKANVKQKEVVGGAILGVLGSKLKAVQGVGDATSTLLQSFAGRPANLKGTYAIQNGVLITKDLKLDGHQSTVFTYAKIDLPAWLIESQSDLFKEGEDPTKPYLTVHLTGPLDKPNPRVKGLFLQSNKSNTIQQLLGGGSVEPEAAPSQTNEGEQEPVVEEKKSNKQKTKDILKGIFKGLGG